MTTNEAIIFLDDFITKTMGTPNHLRALLMARKALDRSRWIPVTERLPEEKINPNTNNFYSYEVTAVFGKITDIRYYCFGRGKWWNGPGDVSEYVKAWREKPEPYKDEE